ncbi:MAG: NADH-quinone oxidoreductase subunit C [Desulfobacterales bacterium]
MRKPWTSFITFPRDYELTHFRVNVPKNIAVPSISHIYACAFLAENEIQDLFNISFTNLSIDFKRTLFLENGIRSGPTVPVFGNRYPARTSR